MPARISPRYFASLGAAVILTFCLCPQGALAAKATRDQQKCVNGLNKRLAKVAKVQGKEICKCIKKSSNSDLGNQSVEQCIMADDAGKVGKAKQHTIDTAADKCLVPPDFGAADPNTVNRAAIDAGVSLIHKIFGADAAIIHAADDKSGAKCQIAVAKAAKKCHDTKLKVFNRCAKDGLAGKGGFPFDSPQDLQDACLGNGTNGMPDPKGKVAKACVRKLGGKINKACTGIDLNLAFPDSNVTDLGELQGYLESIVECEVCLALNDAERLNRDCDLFDNSLADGTCETPPAVCGNGVVDGGEGCDDWNTTSGDGCSSDCQYEGALSACEGVPSVSGTALDAVVVATGFSPLTYVTAPLFGSGDPNRIFVVERFGRIRIIQNGTPLSTPFLDISEGVLSSASGGINEQGLLGLAFDPDYASNGYFYLNYTAHSADCAETADPCTRIVRFSASAGDPDQADPSSAFQLLEYRQPGEAHNGGMLAFGPDGLLYIASGDGGMNSANSQDTKTLLGALLRIDPHGGTPYGIPADNPFAGDPNRAQEIWHYGLRNPWRFSFDRLTGDLWIGDVGSALWEEVNFVPAGTPGGLNFGWPECEGAHDGPGGDCGSIISTPPVLEYDHGPTGGCSIIGGYVYRGCRMPDFRGTYFFSDFCSAFVQTFELVGGMPQNLTDRTADIEDGGVSLSFVTSLGEDAFGELYITTNNGQVIKLVPEN